LAEIDIWVNAREPKQKIYVDIGGTVGLHILVAVLPRAGLIAKERSVLP
jgi:hypothetical protein